MSASVFAQPAPKGTNQLPGPPRPRLVFRIGITGHRPGGSLPDLEMTRIREQVTALLACAAKAVDATWRANGAFFDAQPPLLVAVSALAEGADRIFAEEALRAGWVLDAVLPFAREIYAQDFPSPDAQAAFAHLLSQARAVFELAAVRPELGRETAYEAAGLVLLDHADTLVAIWDGQPGRGRGGTHEIMTEAVRRDVPVIWLSSGHDQPLARWVDGEEAAPLAIEAEHCEDGVGTLGGIIAATLAPPSRARGGEEARSAERLIRYLGERERRPPLWSGAYGLGLRLLSGKGLHAQHPLANRQNESRGFLEALPPMGVLKETLAHVLLLRFVWADSIATRLSAVYRSAYVLNFLLAACAVLVGLFSILDVWNDQFSSISLAKTVCVALESTFIGLIVAITLVGRRRAWHERFLDSRRVAEMLRHARLLAPVGLAGRGLSAAGAVDTGDSWTVWYARAATRELPLPHARVDQAYLRRTVDAVLDEEIAGQIRYHRANHHLLEKVHHRLDRAGEVLFYTTGLLCLVWFVLIAFYGLEGADHAHEISHTLKFILTFLGAVLPAFAAAIGGIRAQGDFGTAAKQSLTTEVELVRLSAEARRRPPEDYRDACVILLAVADRLTSDLGTWRLMSSHRPLSVPG